MKYLVEYGVDLNKEGNNYWILLFYSCQNEYEDIVKYLIDRNEEEIKYLYNKNNKYNNEKEIIYEMINQNVLKYERLEILIKFSIPILNTSPSLIKRLMKDDNKEILEILFKNHFKFFDKCIIINFLNYYKNKIPISDTKLFVKINNEKYKISINIK